MQIIGTGADSGSDRRTARTPTPHQILGPTGGVWADRSVTATDSIRTARPTDAAGIAQLIRQSKAEAMPWLAIPHTLEEDNAWVAGVLLPGHDVRVAVSPTDQGVLLAVLALSPGWVNHLYVASSEQGRGVGSRLLRLAQGTTAEALQLWAFQRNTRARAFYERRGFVELRRTDGDNEERQPDVLYRWELDRA